MFTRIVVGIDGSETSKTALDLACDIAAKYDSELHLVHTPQPQTLAFAMGTVAGFHTVTTLPPPAEVAAACEKILTWGADIASAHNQKIAQTYGNQGDTATEITQCAERIGADLIVTGRRGLGSIGALVQGSTSQQINHLAKCACLSVV